MINTQVGKFLDEDDKQPRYFEVHHPSQLRRIFDPIVIPSYFTIYVNMPIEETTIPQIFTVFPGRS